MISWIQRTFQHHFRLIFAVLLVGMVIPFIFTIGSTPGIGRAEHKSANRDYFGHNLLSQEESRLLMGDAHLSAELQFGSNVSPEQIQYYMLQRVAAQHLADELHLPQPTTAEITDFIKGLRLFAGSDGQFDVSHYDAFRNSLKTGSTVTEADIARVIKDDVRMGKLQRLLAGPGYVMPADVKEVLLKGDTLWTVSTATTDYAGFAPDIRLTDAEISKFFSDNIFRYTESAKAVVDYVEFPTDMFKGSVSPTDAEVREFYDANPSRFPKAAAAKPALVKADPAADYAAVQPQVRQALVVALAQRSAVKAASDLAFTLYDSKVTRDSLASFLAGRKLSSGSLAPFTQDAGPAEFGGSREVAAAAFGLNADRFYSEAVPVPTGAVVLIWKNLLPSRQPTLAEVLGKVRADALDNQKRIRFVEFGRSLKAGIERRLKAGETFETAAPEAAGATHVTLKTYPAFALRDQPHDIDPSVLGALDRLEKGGVSDMEATADKGVVVYAADKKLPATDESNPRYAMIKLQLAATFARTDGTSVMREIVDQELKRSDSAAK